MSLSFTECADQAFKAFSMISAGIVIAIWFSLKIVAQISHLSR